MRCTISGSGVFKIMRTIRSEKNVFMKYKDLKVGFELFRKFSDDMIEWVIG